MCYRDGSIVCKVKKNTVEGVTILRLFIIQFNPLSPNSDKHLISPYSIITWSNIQVMRITGK